jgi:hypothetical protein
MSTFLWIGTGLGAFFGILHGAYIYRQQIAVHGRATGFYYGIWAFALWTLFGAYVLLFWILGFILYSIVRLAPGDRWSARSAKVSIASERHRAPGGRPAKWRGGK